MPSLLARNIRFLRKRKPITQAGLASQIGKSQTAVGNWESDYSEPSIEDLEKLTRFFGVSYNELMGVDLAEGNLIEVSAESEKGNLKGNAKGNLISKNDANEPSYFVENKDLKLIRSLPKVVSVDTHGEENAVMVPIRARAGYLQGYGDPHFIEKLPAYKLPGANNGTYRIFEVEGLSMFPTLQDKDLVIARWTQLSELREDRVHVLVTREHGLLIKRVLSRLNDGVLICKSDHNERGLYPNIVLPYTDVVEAWYCVERMTKHLPSPGEIYKRITDLEADMAVIKQKLTQG